MLLVKNLLLQVYTLQFLCFPACLLIGTTSQIILFKVFTFHVLHFCTPSKDLCSFNVSILLAPVGLHRCILKFPVHGGSPVSHPSSTYLPHIKTIILECSSKTEPSVRESSIIASTFRLCGGPLCVNIMAAVTFKNNKHVEDLVVASGSWTGKLVDFFER